MQPLTDILQHSLHFSNLNKFYTSLTLSIFFYEIEVFRETLPLMVHERLISQGGANCLSSLTSSTEEREYFLSAGALALPSVLIHLRDIVPGIPGQCNDSTIAIKDVLRRYPAKLSGKSHASPFQSRDSINPQLGQWKTLEPPLRVWTWPSASAGLAGEFFRRIQNGGHCHFSLMLSGDL
jgi:hypothetical protein